MNKIEIGDKFQNIWNEVHIITKISNTGLILTTKNIQTSKTQKFRFYEASGKYIKVEKNSSRDLGKLVS